MTETEQALMNRVQAAEYLLVRILSDLLSREPDPLGAGDRFLESIRDDLYFAVTVRTKNPTKSDHLADEVSRVAEHVAGEAVKRIKMAKAKGG